jgi:hypothetical protein
MVATLSPVSGLGHRATLAELFGLDLRSLALFRVVLASVLLVDLAGRLRYLDLTHTDLGLLPTRLVPYPSLHALSGSYAFEVALLGVAACFAVLLLLGVATRLAALVCCVLWLSLMYRNHYLADGGDMLAAKLLLWSAFLPLGARLSLAARRAPVAATRVVSVATVGFIVEFVYFYVAAGVVKSSPEWWSTFTALEQVMGNGYWLQPAGEVLAEYPALLRVLTPVVPLFEVVAPLLLFVPVANGPLRCLVILSLWVFQLGLGLSIHLNLFPFFSTTATLALLPGWLWDRLGIGVGAAGSAREPRWRNALAAVALAGLVVGMTPLPQQLRPPLVWAFWWPGFMHRWTMYAEAPTEDFRFEPEGRFADGSSAKLLEVPDGEAWQRVRDAHASYRIKYFLQKAGPERRLLEPYLAWLCREWNAGTPAAPLSDVKLFVKVWQIHPRGEPRRILLAQRACPTRE